MANLLNHMESLGLSPKRVSSADGGEYASACPGCGDGGKGNNSDRFHVWPDKPGGGKATGRYWCRQCGESGDAIEFLKRFHGMDFCGACSELGISLPNNKAAAHRRYTPSPQRTHQQQEWQPRIYPQPPNGWRDKALAFLADCRKRLANEPEAIAWLERRGLSRGMIDKYSLGYNQSSRGGDRYRARASWGLPEKIKNGKPSKLWLPRGWVIPSFDAEGNLMQLRVRRVDEDIAKFGSNIKYLPIDGSSAATMVLHPEAEVFVVKECGFDAILIAGLLHGRIGAVTTWNDAARPDARAHKLLSQSALILNWLDHDKSGEKQHEWWASTYRQCRRMPCPGEGIKDAGEAYEAGVDVGKWVMAALPPGLHIKMKGPTPSPASKPAPQDTSKKQQSAPEVVEIDLTDGTTIYITDDQHEWQRLSNMGEPVFSRNELGRLQAATSGMNGEDRLQAARQAIEVKGIFGGYVRAGRQVSEDKGDGHEQPAE